MKLKIWQLNDTPELHVYHFTGYELMKEMNLEININNYHTVYIDNDFEPKTKNVLDEIYSIFQGIKPESYTGHSVSVSDIIEFDGSRYYVDSFGFVNLK